ncbi:MAG: CPBP family glutamic-type intramembrane protease [Pseudomonadota bacterium]
MNGNIENILRILAYPTDFNIQLVCFTIVVLSGLLIFKIAETGKIIKHAKLARNWPKLLLVSFFVPALFEEIIFRGLFFAPNRSLVDSAVWLLLSTSLFVAWHFLQSKTFHKQYNAVFTNRHFLVCAAILGVSCYLLLVISDSIWPPIIFHWLIVFVWQALYSGISIIPTKKN